MWLIYDGLRRRAVTATVTYANHRTCKLDDSGSNLTCMINVSYTVDDEPHENRMKVSRSYEVGDTLNVYYVKNNPSNITDSKSTILGVFLIFLPIPLGLLISYGKIYNRRRRHRPHRRYTNSLDLSSPDSSFTLNIRT
jgi:hypothetical protein